MAIRGRRKRAIPEVRLLALSPRAGESAELRILQSEVSVGSTDDNQFPIRRPSISRRHASLAFRDDGFDLTDLNSTNGTFVNGRRIEGTARIEIGDEIRFGDAGFIVGKPAGAKPVVSRANLPRKVFTWRGTFEVALLALAVGFGAAQYLAYLMYHEENRLQLAKAVPISAAPHLAAPIPASSPPATPPTRGMAAPNPPAPRSVSASTPRAEVRATAAPAASRLAPPAAPPSEPVEVVEAPKPAALSPHDKEVAGGVALSQLYSNTGYKAGHPAPNFTLSGLDGTEGSLDSFRGKVILVNFWATWCHVCREELPSLERLYRDFRSYPDFAVVTVNIDQNGQPAVSEFMERNGYDFPVLLDSRNAVSSTYEVHGIPSIFVIGRDGHIIWNCDGGVDWSDSHVRDALKKLL